jgi:uncharacterized membrane protein YeaQ/YmgE (transglycosylase-associated protein family)
MDAARWQEDLDAVFGLGCTRGNRGWLAGEITKGRGFGLLGDLIVGILGSLLGSFLFGLIGIFAYGLVGRLVMAVTSAIVLLWLIRLVKRM